MLAKQEVNLFQVQTKYAQSRVLLVGLGDLRGLGVDERSNF